jgi:hypothetical protein
MLESTERPGELVVRPPSFLQCMKIGAGFALGAGLVSIFGFVFYFLFILGLIGGIADALSPKRSAASAAQPPVISRPAPTQSSEHERLVQDAMRRQRTIDDQIAAEREARKRLEASRRSTVQ